MTGTSINSKIIPAAREKVYHAFIDREALEFWLAPHGMTGKIHRYDPGVNGGYTMSLFYKDSHAKGKTTANEDRFSVKFVLLQPYEKIIQSVYFQSDQEEFAGEMIMNVSLEEVEKYVTKVTMVFEKIPPGIDPKDNESGTEQSLEKLAHYLTGK